LPDSVQQAREIAEAYCAWNNLGGREGVMQNVARNSVMGAIAIPLLFAIIVLLGGMPKTPPK
jgi:hypothetical protein